ncbi:MAG: sigma factor-like helix-turn-helix DNA-binding protein [Tepidisphaeraceae bacterium]
MRLLNNLESHELARATAVAELPRADVTPLAASAKVLAWLPPTQRELLHLLARGGLTHRQVASLLRVSPGTVSRQLARLRARLTHPVVRALDFASEQLDPSNRQLAIDRFLHARTIVALMVEHGLTRHQLNHALSSLRGWARATLAYARTQTTRDDNTTEPEDDLDRT